MSQSRVSSVVARGPLSPAARIQDTPALRTSAQRCVDEAVAAVDRAAGALTTLAAAERDGGCRAAVLRIRAQVRFAAVDLANVGQVPGLPLVEPPAEMGGVEE